MTLHGMVPHVMVVVQSVHSLHSWWRWQRWRINSSVPPRQEAELRVSRSRRFLHDDSVNDEKWFHLKTSSNLYGTIRTHWQLNVTLLLESLPGEQTFLKFWNGNQLPFQTPHEHCHQDPQWIYIYSVGGENIFLRFHAQFKTKISINIWKFVDFERNK